MPNSMLTSEHRRTGMYELAASCKSHVAICSTRKIHILVSETLLINKADQGVTTVMSHLTRIRHELQQFGERSHRAAAQWTHSSGIFCVLRAIPCNLRPSQGSVYIS